MIFHFESFPWVKGSFPSGRRLPPNSCDGNGLGGKILKSFTGSAGQEKQKQQSKKKTEEKAEKETCVRGKFRKNETKCHRQFNGVKADETALSPFSFSEKKRIEKCRPWIFPCRWKMGKIFNSRKGKLGKFSFQIQVFKESRRWES